MKLWIDLIEHGATRATIHKVTKALSRIDDVLKDVISDGVRGAEISGLIRSNQAALSRPVLDVNDQPIGLNAPTINAIYIDPSYRMAQAGPGAAVSSESWWNKYEARHDLADLMAGYLTTTEASWAPVIVLGHPGCGKSLFTKVLAARLPTTEFVPIRVPLRDVPADADIQEQIEAAVRSCTGESASWPDLVRAAAGAVPVVLLDGFDELLQATGVAHTDYLSRIATFQERERDQGRAVAVVVTSRVSVADRARLPAGTLAIRLEPFNDPSIRSWVKTWNASNQSSFQARKVRPLDAPAVLRYRELSAQPLLLLMLAIYDADGNSLRHLRNRLSYGELYERLLTRFAERELRKSHGNFDDQTIAALVERELWRLSVTGSSLF